MSRIYTPGYSPGYPDPDAQDYAAEREEAEERFAEAPGKEGE